MKFILKFVVVITIALLIVVVSLSIWLKTEAAKQQITSFAESFLAKKFGIKANIEGLDISLPIILGAKQVSLKDAGEEIMVIKNFYINIIPSLMSFWEINIWTRNCNNCK
jgi:autotransporter translocation and assembly factor TamB